MKDLSSIKETPLEDHLHSLGEKYQASGQSLSCYLEGLFHAKELTYWDYIRLDSLLSLQDPLTHFPDEMIFIVYHQIVELYFYLILWEMNQLVEAKSFDEGEWLERIQRVNIYLKQVTSSSRIMISGMDKGQFQKFRTRLTPASGFQSVQYRQIEFHATGLSQLQAPRYRESTQGSLALEEMYQRLYWKDGGRDNKTGDKSLTLKSFEEKYDPTLIKEAHYLEQKNLWSQLCRLGTPQSLSQRLREALKLLDKRLNIDWRLTHFKMAVHHLKGKNKSETPLGTGGTNWKKYLPTRFQQIIFFPDLWTEEEKKNWGLEMPDK